MGDSEHWTIRTCSDCEALGSRGPLPTGCSHDHAERGVREVVPAEQLRGAVDLEAATERVMALMVRSYGAARSDETREQAQRLARAALGGQ